MEGGESNSNFSIAPSTTTSRAEGEALPWGAEVIHQNTFESQDEISTFMPLACSSPKPNVSEGEEPFIFENSLTGRQKKCLRVSKRRRIGRQAYHPFSTPRGRDGERARLDEGAWEEQKDSFNEVNGNVSFYFYMRTSPPKSFFNLRKKVEHCEELIFFLFHSFLLIRICGGGLDPSVSSCLKEWKFTAAYPGKGNALSRP